MAPNQRRSATVKRRRAAMTPKQRVLKRYPKAYAKYVGLSLKIVVVSDHDKEISAHRIRERDAWLHAARNL